MTRILLGLLLFPLTALGDDTPEAPQVISVEVTVLELSAHLEIADAADISNEKLQKAVQDARSSGVLKNLTRIRLSTIAGQQSVVEMGETRTVINGWTFTGREKVPNYIVEETGTVFGVVTEDAGDGKIGVALDLRQTRLEPSDLEDDETTDLDFPTKRQHSLKTSVVVSDGKTTLVSGSQQVNADADQLETIVLVRATTAD